MNMRVTAGQENSRRIFVEFIRRNPVVNTYLGGAGLDPSLKDVDGTLRDHSAAALEAEDRWLTDAQKSFEGVDPNTLSANMRIDREVALAQIRFLLRQHTVRRYQERALDTYTDEPFRASDWQLRGFPRRREDLRHRDEWSLWPTASRPSAVSYRRPRATARRHKVGQHP